MSSSPTSSPLMLSVSGARGIVGASMTPTVAAEFAAAFASHLISSSPPPSPPASLIALALWYPRAWLFPVGGALAILGYALSCMVWTDFRPAHWTPTLFLHGLNPFIVVGTIVAVTTSVVLSLALSSRRRVGVPPDAWGGEMRPPDGWRPAVRGSWRAFYGPDNTFPPTSGYPIIPWQPNALNPLPSLPPDFHNRW